MHKAIVYAYASSTYAKRFGRALQGCYVIEVKAHYTDARNIRTEGPFDTLADAEAAAMFIAADWSPYSKRAERAPQVTPCVEFTAPTVTPCVDMGLEGEARLAEFAITRFLELAAR